MLPRLPSDKDDSNSNGRNSDGLSRSPNAGDDLDGSDDWVCSACLGDRDGKNLSHYGAEVSSLVRLAMPVSIMGEVFSVTTQAARCDL